jgi:hypothetical protein
MFNHEWRELTRKIKKIFTGRDLFDDWGVSRPHGHGDHGGEDIDEMSAPRIAALFRSSPTRGVDCNRSGNGSGGLVSNFLICALLGVIARLRQ